jgi:hypothetical protein
MSGDEGGVDIRRHIAGFLPGQRYVQLHTHPGSASFSDADVATLLSWAHMHAMVVVGVDGTWYALSRLGAVTPSARDAVDMFWIESDRLEREQPGLSVREYTHRVWMAIAGHLGPRYDRVQRSEP